MRESFDGNNMCLPFATSIGSNHEKGFSMFGIEPWKEGVQIALNIDRANNGKVVDVVEILRRELRFLLKSEDVGARREK